MKRYISLLLIIFFAQQIYAHPGGSPLGPTKVAPQLLGDLPELHATVQLGGQIAPYPTKAEYEIASPRTGQAEFSLGLSTGLHYEPYEEEVPEQEYRVIEEEEEIEPE